MFEGLKLAWNTFDGKMGNRSSEEDVIKAEDRWEKTVNGIFGSSPILVEGIDYHYDEDGYDENGYDRDGYDRFGLSKEDHNDADTI